MTGEVPKLRRKVAAVQEKTEAGAAMRKFKSTRNANAYTNHKSEYVAKVLKKLKGF